MALRLGKCPNCGKLLRSVRTEPIEIKERKATKWRGLSFCCAACYTVLGVEIDPAVLKNDLLKELKPAKTPSAPAPAVTVRAKPRYN
jgi:hypothetical protein